MVRHIAFKNPVLLKELLNSASVSSGSSFFATNITLPLATGESGWLWCQVCLMTNAGLRFVIDDGSASTSLQTFFGDTNTRSINGGAFTNVYIPVSGNKNVNFGMSVGGSVNFFSCWLVG